MTTPVKPTLQPEDTSWIDEFLAKKAAAQAEKVEATPASTLPDKDTALTPPPRTGHGHLGRGCPDDD